MFWFCLECEHPTCIHCALYCWRDADKGCYCRSCAEEKSVALVRCGECGEQLAWSEMPHPLAEAVVLDTSQVNNFQCLRCRYAARDGD